jgi:MFS transporter, MHS family, citrate/tricarballylate:H+ symporter
MSLHPIDPPALRAETPLAEAAASTALADLRTERAGLPLRSVLAVGLGNALEFYDFLTFSYFAIQIGHTFFPASRTSHSLLLSLATFGIGFLTRPLGAIVIGRYGDRVGRRPAMLWSFGLMGFAILGLALTPSYERIGTAAPVLLVVFRLLQGVALGGEVGPSTAFLVEAAPPERRGLYVAVQMATQYLAGVAAGVVGFFLSDWLSPAQLDAWGWRIALLIGAAVVPLGLYVRRSLPETLQHAAAGAPPAGQQPLSAALLLISLVMLATSTISVYVVDYIITYAQDTLKMSAHLGFGATIVGGLCVLCVAPIGGALSDRTGRKPVMLAALGLLLVLVVPCYMSMTAWRGAASVYASTAVLSTLAGLMTTAALTAISESLPHAVRSAAFGIIYAVAITVFGGFTQFIVKALIDLTASPLAPAWYLCAALLIGGSAMLAMRESAPAALAARSAARCR